ncbi:hypothetical protein ALT721_2520027 [Alteromonas alvinellae]
MRLFRSLYAIIDNTPTPYQYDRVNFRRHSWLITLPKELMNSLLQRKLPEK